MSIVLRPKHARNAAVQQAHQAAGDSPAALAQPLAATSR